MEELEYSILPVLLEVRPKVGNTDKGKKRISPLVANNARNND